MATGTVEVAGPLTDSMWMEGDEKGELLADALNGD